MIAAASHTQVSFEEYLAVERASETKHQYIHGVVHAMSGGTPEHSRLAMAIGRELGNQLAGKRCAVFSSDLRVRVQVTGLATYPDVTVICGKLETDTEGEHTAINPSVIIEVTSPITENYDRAGKWAHYRRITLTCSSRKTNGSSRPSRETQTRAGQYETSATARRAWTPSCARSI